MLPNNILKFRSDILKLDHLGFDQQRENMSFNTKVAEVLTTSLVKKVLICKIINVTEEGFYQLADDSGEILLDAASSKPHQANYLSLGKSIRLVNPGVCSERKMLVLEKRTHIFQSKSVTVKKANQRDLTLNEFLPNQVIGIFIAKGKSTVFMSSMKYHAVFIL